MFCDEIGDFFRFGKCGETIKSSRRRYLKP